MIRPQACPTVVPERPLSGGFGGGRDRGNARGFTLVELLVVIGIIAVLAGLLTPAVMQALRTTRNAAIRAEINMLHMAMLNYQSEYGVLPPAFDSTFSGNPAGRYKPTGEAARHLRRLFPRCSNVVGQLDDAFMGPAGRVQLHPRNAVVLWLRGFTVDLTSPLVPDPGRVRLYDFDRARIVPETLEYHPAGSKDSPYLYVDAPHYFYVDSDTDFRYRAQDLTRPGAQFVPVQPLDYKPPGEPDSWYFTYDALDTLRTTGRSTEPFNIDTFQILCAGRDGVFGTDDDLSNFWPGTRGEYLESLKAR